VSRSFYEVVSCLSREYANLFRHEGARTDKHVREHDVYAVVGSKPSRSTDALSQAPAAHRRWFGFQRSALIGAPIVFLAIVAGGVAARALMEPQAEPVPPPPPPKAVAAQKPVAAAVPAAAAKKSGRLEISVAPWGEVLVDGKSRGVSPPLRELEIAAGPHTIEIRNSTFPARVEKVQIKPGEATKIRHRFR
jgi:hypothetical protein